MLTNISESVSESVAESSSTTGKSNNIHSINERMGHPKWSSPKHTKDRSYIEVRQLSSLLFRLGDRTTQQLNKT